MQDERKNHWFALLVLSLLGAFVVAVVYVVVFTLTLPPSDGANGEAPFADSLVLPIMTVGATLAGILTFALAHRLLRRANLLRSFGFTLVVLLTFAGFRARRSHPSVRRGHFAGVLIAVYCLVLVQWVAYHFYGPIVFV